MLEEEKIIPTMGCNNCGGRCIIHAHVSDGKINRISTELPGEVAEGQAALTACVRGMNYHKTFLGPDRLLYPMKRVGKRGQGIFERISWDQALDIIASEWVRIRDSYGTASRYVHYGWGQSTVLRGNSLAKRLLAMDGGYLDSYNSYSTACIKQATKLMYGTNYSGNSPEDLLNTEFVILWGHNPSETKFDSVTMYYLRKLKDRGIPIVVIDPRKSDTVLDLDAEWIAIRPGTDPAMMDAMAYVIYHEGLQDQAFLDSCCSGFDSEHMPDGYPSDGDYLSYINGVRDGVARTPEWAEAITGVSAETIRSLAVRYASAGRAALLQGYGPQRNAYGEQVSRGGIVLACMTGNVGVSGGSASGHGEVALHEVPDGPAYSNPYPGSIPVYRWTDALDHGHEMTGLQGVKGVEKLDSDIKMIINLGGNCLINQHGDINRTSELLADESKCEFILCSDLFMTSSAKYADILLPGCSFLETDNMVNPWKYDTFLGYVNKVVEPVGESRFEYDWLCELADRLGYGEAFSEGRTSYEWLRYSYDELKKKESELPDFETFKSRGIHRYEKTDRVIAFEDFVRNPEGNPLNTPSGKIEIFSQEIYDGEFEDFMPSIPCYVPFPEGPDDPAAEKYPLQLTGWHTKRRCHSIHDNNLSMHRIDPQCLWMHAEDASDRGLHDGEDVIVFNDRGKIILPLKITDRIMKGVCAVSQGAWYRPDQEGIDRGGCINVLTSLRPTPYARGNAQHTNLVQVDRILWD